MTDTKRITRSQLLLQYLFAEDTQVANNDLLEPSRDVPEARAAAGDSECSA